MIVAQLKCVFFSVKKRNNRKSTKARFIGMNTKISNLQTQKNRIMKRNLFVVLMGKRRLSLLFIYVYFSHCLQLFQTFESCCFVQIVYSAVQALMHFRCCNRKKGHIFCVLTEPPFISCLLVTSRLCICVHTAQCTCGHSGHSAHAHITSSLHVGTHSLQN